VAGDVWLEEVNCLQAQLQDYGKSVRMEGFQTPASKKSVEAQRAAEEKRKKEALRQVKLRQMAKEAQNPKRRIALRLDECREFGSKTQDAVPMRSFVDYGGFAQESLEVVDVSAMQARCLGLIGAKGGVKGLTEEKARADSCRRWEKDALPEGLARDFVRLNKEATNSGTLHSQSPLTLSRLSSDDRFARAKASKAQTEQDWMAHKVCTLRASWNLEFSPIYGRFDSATLRDMVPSSPAGSPKNMLMKAVLLRRTASRWSADSEAKVDGHRLKLAMRARQLRGMLTGVLWMCSLVASVRMKHPAADAVLHFCDELANTRALRQSMKRLIGRIRMVQTFFRTFLARKAAWVKEKSEVWTIWEDFHLQAHFKKTRASSPRNAQPSPRVGKKGQSPRVNRQSPRGNGDEEKGDGKPSKRTMKMSSPEWFKALRIPVAYRERTLSNWYVAELWKSVNAFRLWLVVVASVSRCNEDMRHFRQLCRDGLAVADARRASGLRPSSSSSAPWLARAAAPLAAPAADSQEGTRHRRSLGYRGSVRRSLASRSHSTGNYVFAAERPPIKFGEAQVLELVAEAAQALRKTNLTFGEHPANKGRRRGNKSTPSAWEATSAATRAAAQEAQAQAQAQAGGASRELDALEAGKVDFDSLFSNFHYADVFDDGTIVDVQEPAQHWQGTSTEMQATVSADMEPGATMASTPSAAPDPAQPAASPLPPLTTLAATLAATAPERSVLAGR